MPQPSVGSVFAGHRIEGLVGRGGMGVVYRARQLDLGRVVALKIVADDLLEDPDARKRFLHEARAAASIDHPNVIPVFGAGEADGVAYLTMRHVDGDDVRTLVRRGGPLEPGRAARIAAQVGAALDAIHAAGLVHRDVKPANVLLGPGDHVYLTDFGLAKSALSRGGQTGSGQWVGTLDYVAPEQIRGQHADARADVYALGGVLHYMLTGHVPYQREGDEAKLWAHLADPPPRPSALGAPESFDAVIARAMAKVPEERHPSAGDLGRTALAAARGEQPSGPERTVARGQAAPQPPGPTDPTRLQPASEAPTRSGSRPRAARRGLAGATALLAIAAAVAAFLVLAPTPESEPRAERPFQVLATYEEAGERPNGVALAGGLAWVTSFSSTELVGLDPDSGEAVHRIRVGAGASDILADGTQVWVALTRADRVVRVDARTGRVGERLDVFKPNSLALTERSIWVGSRTAAGGQPDTLVRFDRRTGVRATSVLLPEGVNALLATGTDLWIAHRRVDRVSRMDLLSGERTLLPRALGGGRLVDLAQGAGYVWVSNEEGVLGRIEPEEEQVATIATGGRAGQVALGGGRVWVALVDAGEVTSIDVETSRRAGENLPVGLNPYGVAARGETVYVTSRGDGTLTRIGR